MIPTTLLRPLSCSHVSLIPLSQTICASPTIPHHHNFRTSRKFTPKYFELLLAAKSDSQVEIKHELIKMSSR